MSSNAAGNNHGSLQDVTAVRDFINCAQTQCSWQRPSRPKCPVMVNDCFLLRLSSKVHQAHFIFHIAMSLHNIMHTLCFAAVPLSMPTTSSASPTLTMSSSRWNRCGTSTKGLASPPVLTIGCSGRDMLSGWNLSSQATLVSMHACTYTC